MPPTLRLSPTEARRLAVSAQGLDRRPPTADADAILQTVDALGCIQIDPIRAVDYTQHLVLWSRLGAFDRADLTALLYDRYSLFEYWAHCASIVSTGDYPIHATSMRAYAAGAERDMAWLAANPLLHDHITERLASEGPLSSDQFDDSLVEAPWRSSGWSNNRSSSMMLTFLWLKGEIMVARREGRKRFWHLSERTLPSWTPRTELSEAETVRRAAERALLALGVATSRQITRHFTRNNYPGLTDVLAGLERDGIIVRAAIDGADGEWPDDWYIHVDRLADLAAIQRGDWRGKTTLLSPFDNLICDRDRTEQLFDFRYRIEIYVPKAKREFGYYVLPILHQERLIGRVDAKLDRKKMHLTVNNVYAETDAPPVGAEVTTAIEELAGFVGATSIAYTGKQQLTIAN